MSDHLDKTEKKGQTIRKTKLFLIFMWIFVVAGTVSLHAQETRPGDVPKEVQKNFNKRFPNAQDVSWNKVDSSYKADFYFKDRLTYAEFRKSGIWVTTVVDQDLDNLLPAIRSYIEDNFPKTSVLFVERATTADKKDYFYAQLSQKTKGNKEPAIIELFFDKLGKIEQVKKPEGYNDMTTPGVKNPNALIPTAVIDTWKKRYPNAAELTWARNADPFDTSKVTFTAKFLNGDIPTKSEYMASGEWIQTREKVDAMTIYPPVKKYIDENYKRDKVILAEKITRKDRKDFYYVKLKHREEDDEIFIYELYFDKAGKLTDVDRPIESRNKFLMTIDLPLAVTKKFNSRFPNVKDAIWEKSEGVYTGSFSYKNVPTITKYNEKGEWIETLSEMEPRQLWTPIQRYIDQHYNNYKVTYAEKVVRKDKKDHYYVEMIGRKKSITPQNIALYFDKAGKLKEVKEEGRE